jgi:hypothetical protein
LLATFTGTASGSIPGNFLASFLLVLHCMVMWLLLGASFLKGEGCSAQLVLHFLLAEAWYDQQPVL